MSPPAPPSRPRRLVLPLALSIVVLGTASAGAWYWYKNRSETVKSGKSHRQSGDKVAEVITVDVVSPSPGGIDRICMQPGTIEPFEAADLYAKVSGFLTEQSVDIGSPREGGASAGQDCCARE